MTRSCCLAPALLAAALFASCAIRPANRPPGIAKDRATTSAGASSAVELRFDWPVALTGRVERSSRGVRESPAYSETLELTSRCRLVIVSYPESGVLRDNAENVTQKLAPAVLGTTPADPIWLEMSIVDRSELVTEPDTLIPHRLESVRRMKRKIRLPDGTVMPLEETTTEALTYDYD